MMVQGLAVWLAAFGTGDSIRAADFEKLHTLIRPTESECAWEQLPWMTDLWEARTRAAAEGKPVLLWMRDGHPLGCV